MNTITYSDSTFGEYTDIPLGTNPDVRREDGDIVLERGVAPDLPLTVAIQIKADGEFIWWHSDFSGANLGAYWHFAHAPLGVQHGCTDAQRETLRRMQSGDINIFGMRCALGRPVINWAFGEQDAQLADAYHD